MWKVRWRWKELKSVYSHSIVMCCIAIQLSHDSRLAWRLKTFPNLICPKYYYYYYFAFISFNLWGGISFPITNRMRCKCSCCLMHFLIVARVGSALESEAAGSYGDVEGTYQSSKGALKRQERENGERWVRWCQSLSWHVKIDWATREEEDE